MTWQTITLENIEPERLRAFEVKHPGVSCTISGEEIPQDVTGYAYSYDHLRNGSGICEAVYKKLSKPTVRNPKADEAPAKGDEE